MARYAAFLRAVNLGSTRKAPSEKLVAAFERAGFEDVATFRTSGNVVFTGSGSAGKKNLRRRSRRACEKELGFEVPSSSGPRMQIEAIAAEKPVRGEGGRGLEGQAPGRAAAREARRRGGDEAGRCRWRATMTG